MKKVCVIINPISGAVSKKNVPVLIKKMFHPDLFETTILKTEYAGHATELTRQALTDGFDYIIAAGGDGTVNEVARTMVHSNSSLGIIPLGSGNGLARDLGISMDVKKAIETIIAGNEITIDYCKANEHIFFCTCGVGFDALVCERFSEEKKRGSISYVKSAITEYIRFRPDTYKIILDNKEIIDEKAFLITCANASQYGNNAYIAPNASIQDGKMDIVVLAPLHPMDVGPVAVQLFTKQLKNNNRVNHYRSEKVKIERSMPGPMHIDGDPTYAGKEIVIETIPLGLRVIAPEESAKIQPIQRPMEDVQLFFRELVHRFDKLK
ncbi:MAG: diacylglycerol kinase family lipid kinase [Candidatus Azobacteroides sp.]|nr:diacylglycerol kinase family lipid kinase [Candidatus Azobacteroides sp.]